jgi:hypothetical protein
MKNIQSPFEPLIPLLLQDWWSSDEACMIFTGYVWKGAGGRLTDIKTGEVIAEFRAGGHGRSAEHELINDRYIEICQVWDGSDHARDTGIYKSSQVTPKWNKYYILDWALTKAPVIEIPWLDWAYEKGFLNQKDRQRMRDLLGAKVVAVDTGKELGEDELTNRNRLIAILKNMHLDPEVGKKWVFQNQESIADYIENNFNAKYPGKKLTANGVKEIFALGNKALKDTE